MPFFQNPFAVEFRGNLLLGDRQHIPTFVVPANRNGNDLVIGFLNEPYDLSSDAVLTINFAFDRDFKNYGAIPIDVSTTAADTSAVLASEVVSALNGDSTFADYFTASIKTQNQLNTVLILSKRERVSLKFYISNTSAEKHLKFNRYAGVAELPTYFVRHTIDNRVTYPDSAAMLVALNTGDATDQQIITDAGLDYTTVQADYQLLRGRSGLFNFQKLTVDDSDRITQIIEYPAGALTGDFGRKTTYTYTSTNTKPDTIAEVPYTITDGDLITP